MQASPWSPELPFPAENCPGAPRCSDALPANSGESGRVTLRFTRQSRNRRAIIISTASSAILALVLAVYLCLSSIGLRKSDYPITRRLASNDQDEKCQHLIELTGTGDELEDGISSGSTEPLQGADPVERTGPITREERNENLDEDAEQAKKPLLERELHNLTEHLQGPSGPSPGSSEASSAQRQAASLQETHISGGLQRSHEASTSPVKTTSDGAEPLAGLDLLEKVFAGDEPVEQWFIDYILHSSLTSSIDESIEPSGDAHQLAEGVEELLQDTGVVGRSSSAKRRHSAGDQGVGLQQVKRLLLEEESQQLTEGLHSPSDPSLSSPSEVSSAQQQAFSHEINPSGGVQGADEASTSSLTKEVEAKSDGPVPFFLENLFAEQRNSQQRSFGYTVSAPVSSLQGSSVKNPENADQLAEKTKAHDGYQVAARGSSSHEHVSSAASVSVSGGGRLSHSETQGVQGSANLPGVSTDLGSSSRPLHGSQPPVAARPIPEVRNTPLQSQSFVNSSAVSIAVYAPQTSAAGEFPSTSQPQAPESLQTSITDDEEALKRHPFYRLPGADFSGNIMPFSYARAARYTTRSHFPEVLASVRELLIKQQLRPNEIQSLILLAEQLVKAVCNMGKFSHNFLAPHRVREPAARRFLIADALWGISEVVGPLMRKDDWWNEVMDRLLLIPPMSITMRKMESDGSDMVIRIIAALRVYQGGRRPPPREVIELKRMIFCSPKSPYMFRSPAFDKFREDDAP
ncbi:hypothetical protein EBH_0020700 [Eimeria brunetti]|uniref:Transmembrane protein n=1 Tax=Eimeria brunetti TaxID=51314 RepID=U6LXU4_9EIME|nr:hypothetical protein EBH_0020700 [Eimeria brunetti]